MALRLTVISALVGLLPTAAAAEPIHDAAARGDVDAVKRLLAESTSVDQFETTARYGRKTTALYRATMAGRSEVVELLLDAGAIPRIEQPSIASRISEGVPDCGAQIYVKHYKVCHLQPGPNDRSSLHSLIALPGGFVPGTLMEPLDYTPPSEEDRISLIAYLRSMSDDPVSLPD
jgi:hypothetical protein